MNKKPPGPEANPMRDSWRPEDKAEEASLDDPAEFANPTAAAEDSVGPVPTTARKTHGELEEKPDTSQS